MFRFFFFYLFLLCFHAIFVCSLDPLFKILNVMVEQYYLAQKDQKLHFELSLMSKYSRARLGARAQAQARVYGVRAVSCMTSFIVERLRE